jgi:MATE family multidrug resistance protein
LRVFFLKGRAIGAGDVHLAKQAARQVILTALTCGAAIGATLFSWRTTIARLYTEDQVILSATASLLRILPLVVIVDALNNSLGGVMCGLGLQRRAAIAQLTGYYFVGMPVSLLVVFGSSRFTDVAGASILWGGVALSMSTSSLLQLKVPLPPCGCTVSRWVRIFSCCSFANRWLFSGHMDLRLG